MGADDSGCRDLPPRQPFFLRILLRPEHLRSSRRPESSRLTIRHQIESYSVDGPLGHRLAFCARLSPIEVLTRLGENPD